MFKEWSETDEVNFLRSMFVYELKNLKEKINGVIHNRYEKAPPQWQVMRGRLNVDEIGWLSNYIRGLDNRTWERPDFDVGAVKKYATQLLGWYIERDVNERKGNRFDLPMPKPEGEPDIQ